MRRMTLWALAVIAWPALVWGQTSEELVAKIRDLEYRRAPVDLVVNWLDHHDPRVRTAAVTAVARIGDARGAGYLARLLVDPDRGTRRRAIHGLGLIGHRRALPLLISATKSTDADDRAWAVWSIGLIAQLDDKKLSDEQRQTAYDVVSAMFSNDTSKTVRGRAAIALGFIKHPDGVALLEGALSKVADDQRWKLIYGIGRIGSAKPAARKAVAAFAAEVALPPKRWTHEFCAWYLARIDHASAAAPLRVLTRSASWMAAASAARGLGKHPGPETTKALVAALGHPAWQARTEAAIALGKLGATDAAKALDRLRRSDDWRSVRAAAAGALVSCAPDRARALLGKSTPAHQRRAAAAALGKAIAAGGLEADDAQVALAKAVLANAPMRVRAALSGALAPKSTGPAYDLLLSALEVDDVAVRGNAAWSLAKADVDHGPRAAEAAIKALQRSTAKGYGPVRAELCTLLGKVENLDDNGKTALLAALVKDEREDVRKAAAKALKEVTGRDHTARPAPPKSQPHLPIDTPLPKKPMIVIETDKGDVEVELYPSAAPAHVRAILDLVGKGFYDGKIFHRVVASFVAQGGAPRPDGWGEVDFVLRDEINLRAYTAGTLGMPKAGKDTGSCQLFFTHLPTPHLDGRYTVFGRVTRGKAAIDRIEVGDRIVRVVRVR